MSKKLRVDVWGHSELDAGFETKPAIPYQVETPASDDTGITYTRYLNRAVTCIHRTTVSNSGGRQTIVSDVAYGAWADRATLTYEAPEKFPKTVDFEEA